MSTAVATNPVVVRPYDNRTDAAFLRTIWVSSHRHSVVGGLMGPHHDGRWNDVITHLLETETTRVATPHDERDVIIGFACLRPPSVVHYVAVKPFARRRGVARLLLADVVTPFTMTHRTIDVERILQSKRGLCHYDLTRLWLP